MKVNVGAPQIIVGAKTKRNTDRLDVARARRICPSGVLKTLSSGVLEADML